MQQIHRLSRRELKTILHHTGNVCVLLAAAMLIPILITFIYNEPRYIAPFIYSAIISAVIGFVLVKLFKIEIKMTLKSAMIFSTIIWLIACALGAMPYYLSGELSYLNSYFEAMSGFTTTGFSMYSNVDAVSYTMNFWRAFTQWIGGLGIIFLLLALLRSTGVDVMRLYLAEGREERLVPSIKHSTRIIVYMYLLFTFIAMGLFLIAGMPVFDSVFHAFTTLSTGGFGMHNSSLLFYNSVWIEIAAMIVMMIGATNYALHYTILKGNWREYFRDIETKVAFGLIIISTILVTFMLYNNQVYGHDFLLNLRFSLFQMVSAITTTWPANCILPGYTQ
jgi:Trk-type K+ transport systems, membrane components